MKPAAKSEIKKETKVKEENSEQKSETIIVADENVKDVKLEKHSPEDVKGSKAPAKKTQLKNQKPVQKGSISSFFSNKPCTSKAVNEKPKEKPVEVTEEPEEKPQVADDHETESKSKKRTITTDEVPVAAKEVDKKRKPAPKKIKLKELAGNKRSRIRVMQDSSDEDEETNEPEEPESKFIKFDRELSEEETSPVQIKDSPEKKPLVGQNKHVAKRWVTKRFQTEDGFVRTERFQEEYSASEDENDENEKKNSPPTKEKPQAERKSAEKKQPITKPKPAPTVKGKQGNITSFFTKK